MGVHETSIHVSRRACPPPPPYYSLCITSSSSSLASRTDRKWPFRCGRPQMDEKLPLCLFLLSIFHFSNSMRFTTNNRHRSVFVRAPVDRGPLSTVKHICFITFFLLNLTGRPGGPNGFKLLLLCVGCGDRAWHLRHSRLIRDLLP